MNETLSKCPICDGSAARVVAVHALSTKYCVQCSFCGLSTKAFRNPEDADSHWNHRPAQNRAAADRDALEELVFMALSIKDPMISIDRGREMLGFVHMEDMREFLEKKMKRGGCEYE